MQFERTENGFHIRIEANETEKQVLRVLLQSSFALARPVTLIGRDKFNPTDILDNDLADRFLAQHNDGFEVNDGMGRWCATRIHKISDGVFELNTFIFERDRGIAEPFLTLAQDILAGRDQITPELRSTKYMYEDQALTRILSEYCVKRKDGESDWDLRRRAFIEYEQDYVRGLEFFMGASCFEWTESQRLFASFYAKPLSKEERIRFVAGMPIDPQILG